MIQGIEHTAIASPDPRKLAAWYVEQLGFVINHASSSSRGCFIKAPDGSMIEIIEASGSPLSVADPKAPGLRHMALTVTDFPAACARLREKGIKFMAEPATSGGTSTVFFTDPEGNILHLIQREKPLP